MLPCLCMCAKEWGAPSRQTTPAGGAIAWLCACVNATVHVRKARVCVCVLGQGSPVGAHSSLQGSHPGLQGLQSAPYLAAQEVQGGTQSCG
jgi:hypothetical protein